MANRNTNGTVVRFEKRTTNKIGLFFVILIALAFFGFGGYYLYQHRHELEWEVKLPWQNEESEENSDKDKGNNSEIKNGLVLPHRLDSEFTINGDKLRVYNPEIDDMGYVITVEFTAIDSDAVLTSESIIVNGYETSTKFTLEDKLDSNNNEQLPSKTTFRILKTDLTPLKITGIDSITLCLKAITSEGKEKISRVRVNATNIYAFDSGISGQVEIYNRNDIKISYYQTIDDQDYTYIYFEINNGTSNQNQLRVKKLLINGKLYEYKDFDFKIYSNAKNIFYLSIPKSDIKNVENITVSFFIIESTSSGSTNIHMTSDYSREI